MTNDSNSYDPTPQRPPLEDRLDQRTRDTLDTIESLADGAWGDDGDGLGAVLATAYEEIVRLAALRPDPVAVAELTDEEDGLLPVLDTMADVPGDWGREDHGNMHGRTAALFRRLLGIDEGGE